MGKKLGVEEEDEWGKDGGKKGRNRVGVGGGGRGRSGRELTGVTRKVSRRYFKGTNSIHWVGLGKV